MVLFATGGWGLLVAAGFGYRDFPGGKSDISFSPMSLAEQLKQRRESGLRQGETVVVDRFGKRFREVTTTVEGEVCRTLVPVTAQQTHPPPHCIVASLRTLR